jgi:hypothetical protein
LLEILAGDQKTIKVTGFPWALTEKSLRPKTLESQILCSRHNSALSGLDAIAGRLFDFLLCVSTTGYRRPQVPVALFNGHDLERWMLKVLCGVVTSDNAIKDDVRIRPVAKPPVQWLRTLFYHRPFPAQCGIYFMNAAVGTQDALVAGFSHAPLSRDNHVYGNIIGLNNIKFCLAMIPADRLSPNSILKDSIHRVEHLIFKAAHATHTLLLAWSQKGDRLGVEINVTPMRPDQSPARKCPDSNQ